MATGKPSASCTERAARVTLPFVFTIAKLQDRSLSELGQALGVRSPTRDAITAALRDENAVRERLARCPALSLVALEIIADLGGMAPAALLAPEITRRSGASPALAEAAVSAVLSSSACVKPTFAPGQKIEAYALFDVCADAVAAMVSGLTLPRAAPPPDVPGTATREVRDMIALAGFTAHRALRLTQRGSPNRSSLRGMIKGTGLDPDRADRLLKDALERGIIAGPGTAHMQASLLLDAASGRAMSATDADLDALLPKGRWVSIEAVARALLAQCWHEHSALYLSHPQLVSTMQRHVEDVQRSPAIEAREDGGVIWIRRRSSGTGTGDGHVTPNFEVMLGPSASADVTAQVALGGELVRVDHLLTFRILPRTIEAGLAVGMDGEGFLTALERVGPRGVPDNVRAMVKDWIQNNRLARAEDVLLLRVASRHEEAIAAALGGDLLGRMGPGALVVKRDRWSWALSERLEKIGYRVKLPWRLERREEEEVFEDDDDFDEEFEEEATSDRFPPSLPPVIPPWAEPDARLVNRFDAARAGGFSGDTARPLSPAPVEKALPPAPPRHPVDEVARGEAVRLASELLEACRGEVDAWLRCLPEAARTLAQRALDYPLLWSPIVALKPAYRSQVLAPSRSLKDAIETALWRGGGSRRLPAGSELMTLIGRAQLGKKTDALDALQELERGGPRRGGVLELFAGAPPAPVTTSPNEIRDRVERARRDGLPLTIRTASGSGVREQTVRVEDIRPVGHDTCVLVMDVATDEGRAVRFEDIRSAFFAKQAPAAPVPR